MWVLKLDNSGNKQWSKIYGGSGNDIGIYNNTFAIGGYTTSNNGDVSSNAGQQDAWFLQLDINGNKLYSKTYGGSAEDQFSTIVATTDGVIVTGYSHSKDGDIISNHGDFDVWMVKLAER